jgi:hypothetical protein
MADNVQPTESDSEAKSERTKARIMHGNGRNRSLDRYSRFAKVGGEMVSLGSVESALALCGT